jgi:transcription initiation factor TFIIE subunit beta
MALSQKLAQFNKQQEKLQASLAKLNPPRPTAAPAPAKGAPAASRKAPAAPASQNSVPFSQRFSFATEKEKLQQIATIQRAPVGAQIKRVLDLLLEVGRSFGEELEERHDSIIS